MSAMMQSLLADRFKLEVHTDARELPIYALVLASSDGTLGSTSSGRRRLIARRSLRHAGASDA